MLKKTITYTNLLEEKVTETAYFHLTKKEMIDLQFSEKEGFEAYLQKMIKEEDQKKLYALFKEILLMAYGVRSEDGRNFEKSDELREKFEKSQFFGELVAQLMLEGDAATNMAEFINAVVPSDLPRPPAPVLPPPVNNS